MYDRQLRFLSKNLLPIVILNRLRRWHDYSRITRKAVTRSLEIVDRCRFSLSELKYQYPKEVSSPGLTPQEALEKYTKDGCQWRYPNGTPDKSYRTNPSRIKAYRSASICTLFSDGFLVSCVSQDRKIFFVRAGGSAANSAVCFVLGITSIDPMTNNLLFERFISQERRGTSRILTSISSMKDVKKLFNGFSKPMDAHGLL